MGYMTRRIQQVEEHDYGVYVWYTAEGQRVEDEDGNVLHIPARRGDYHAINIIGQEAKSVGVPDGGRAVFLGGRRTVTQSEWEDQQARHRAGLIADPNDFKALEDELRINKTRND